MSICTGYFSQVHSSSYRLRRLWLSRWLNLWYPILRQYTHTAMTGPLMVLLDIILRRTYSGRLHRFLYRFAILRPKDGVQDVVSSLTNLILDASLVHELFTKRNPSQADEELVVPAMHNS